MKYFLFYLRFVPACQILLLPLRSTFSPIHYFLGIDDEIFPVLLYVSFKMVSESVKWYDFSAAGGRKYFYFACYQPLAVINMKKWSFHVNISFFETFIIPIHTLLDLLFFLVQ